MVRQMSQRVTPNTHYIDDDVSSKTSETDSDGAVRRTLRRSTTQRLESRLDTTSDCTLVCSISLLIALFSIP